MKIIRRLLCLLCWLATIAATAQEVQVKTFKELTADLSARTNRRFDGNDKACALIKVQCPEAGATFEGFVVGESEQKGNEYWVYVAEGAKRIKMHIPGYDTVELTFADFDIRQLVGNTTYVIEFKFPSKFKVSPYVEAGFLAGMSVMGPELSLGAYLGGFNIEANVLLPLAGAETIYWKQDGQKPLRYTYKPSLAFGGRLGYGIMLLNEKLRITPQVGVRFIRYTETAEYDPQELHPAKGANSLGLVVACKFQYMFTKHIGVSLTPEYQLPVAKSKGYAALAESSGNIKKWSNGVGGKLAINVEF